ncbi:MAG: Holliday junction branch migration protein RuvA [Actinomycetota bacterium]|nr:Holliday junction branch migration protein RuvA [Actinomycetota bacterium]
MPVIGALRGTVIDRRARRDQSAEVVVDVGGVGYRLIAPAAALGGWRTDTEVQVWVHTHVREDAIILYGFTDRDQRNCFETLIGTHGIGPGVALAILSVHTPEGLRRAVTTEDLDALMLVPGIGKKTAARLVVELKDRLEGDDFDVAPFTAPSAMTRGPAVEARSGPPSLLLAMGPRRSVMSSAACRPTAASRTSSGPRFGSWPAAGWPAPGRWLSALQL